MQHSCANEIEADFFNNFWAQVRRIDGSLVTDAIAKVAPKEPALMTGDDIGLIWLKNRKLTLKIVRYLNTPSIKKKLGIKSIMHGHTLSTQFGTNSRVPDMILVTQYGEFSVILCWAW